VRYPRRRTATRKRLSAKQSRRALGIAYALAIALLWAVGRLARGVGISPALLAVVALASIAGLAGGILIERPAAPEIRYGANDLVCDQGFVNCRPENRP
jgi:hypothetical protein